MESHFLLGVLGGLGPMSTMYFCELLTSHTKAHSDADHIDMLISSRATTPDRTAFILGQSKNDPLPVMVEEAHRLEDAGADLLVIPCNTAHYFYNGLQAKCKIPILNIISETVDYLHSNQINTFGLLATEGTVKSGSYHRICEKYGMNCIVPTPEEQEDISSAIYGEIKQNKPANREKILEIARKLLDKGCQRIVLGCTELSLIHKEEPLDSRIFTDSLEVLAYKTILSCNKTPVGFPDSFSMWAKKELPV